MLKPDQAKKTAALGIATVWALLYGISVADAVEDAGETPEECDQLVAQALTTPAEPAVYLAGALPGTLTAPAFVSALVVDDFRTLPVEHVMTPFIAPPQGPPSRASPNLFQLFSVYRL